MSVSAAQASAFFTETQRRAEVWSIRDPQGFPTSTNSDGERAMPFWSKKSRALRFLELHADYAGFAPEAVPLDAFIERWLPGLANDGFLVGINWSGPRGTGYDMAPDDVARRYTGG